MQVAGLAETAGRHRQQPLHPPAALTACLQAAAAPAAGRVWRVRAGSGARAALLQSLTARSRCALAGWVAQHLRCWRRRQRCVPAGSRAALLPGFGAVCCFCRPPPPPQLLVWACAAAPGSSAQWHAAAAPSAKSPGRTHQQPEAQAQCGGMHIAVGLLRYGWRQAAQDNVAKPLTQNAAQLACACSAACLSRTVPSGAAGVAAGGAPPDAAAAFCCSKRFRARRMPCIERSMSAGLAGGAATLPAQVVTGKHEVLAAQAAKPEEEHGRMMCWQAAAHTERCAHYLTGPHPRSSSPCQNQSRCVAACSPALRLVMGASWGGGERWWRGSGSEVAGRGATKSGHPPNPQTEWGVSRRRVLLLSPKLAPAEHLSFPHKLLHHEALQASTSNTARPRRLPEGCVVGAAWHFASAGGFAHCQVI